MTPGPARRRVVVGLMTGTSLDGIDTVAAAVTGEGLELRASVLGRDRAALGEIAGALRRAAGQEPLPAADTARLALDLGVLHADAAAAAARGRGPVDLVAAHGQTIVHRPPVSWQLLNPAPVAARLNCPVVFDLRQADLAAGGRGAPITPLADWVLFRQPGRRRAVVNLGGFCNVTVLPPAGDAGGPGAVGGFDVCACNQVLDEVARRALDAPFDEGGRVAAAGHSDLRAADALAARLERQRRAGRSLGTGDEARGWVEAHAGRLRPGDLAASAVQAIAATIAGAVAAESPDEVVVAGGGARNAALVEVLRRSIAAPLRLSDELGVAAEAREALAVAVLGTLCADGVPITLPQVTGCRAAPVAGTWCPAPAAGSSGAG